jgi:alanine racemase
VIPVLRVDLDAFARNLATIRRTVAPAEHMLVVKDDAYGHGLAPIVRQARDEGLRWFGAFDVSTAAKVRSLTGSSTRIFVWMLSGRGDAQIAAAAALDVGVGDEELLEEVAAAATSAPVRVHLKIDTGLHRNGIRPERWDAACARAARLQAEGHISVVGIWSHIAEASDEDDDDARRIFDDAVETARRHGLTGVRHLAASAAAFARPEFRYEVCRIGAFAYGIRAAESIEPRPGLGREPAGIEPVATIVAPVIEVRGPVAVVGIGAAHGIPSVLAGVISVGTPRGPRRLLHVGADRCEVESWEGAAPGDGVAVLGRDAPHTATDAAERIGTIGEEIAVRAFASLEHEYLAADAVDAPPQTTEGALP